jgi:hypothetical protein
MACLRGTRVRLTTAADLVNDLVAAQARNALHRRLALWSVPQLLVAYLHKVVEGATAGSGPEPSRRAPGSGWR